MSATRTRILSQLPKKDWVPLEGPLLVIMHFRMPLPKNLSLVKKNRYHNAPHTLRPDGDNLEKWINDCMTGLVWRDDAQITFIYRTKTRTKDKIGETVIYVQELKPDEVPDYKMVLEAIKENVTPDGLPINYEKMGALPCQSSQ